MANYVYTKPNRTGRLYANNCNVSHLDIKYYCSTPGCPARLTIRSLNGDVTPYFAALKSFSHDESICSGGRTQGTKTEYDISNFSIESLYNSITSKSRTDLSYGGNDNAGGGNSEPNTEEITTPTKLYYFCKGHDIDHIIANDIKVKNLIADSRTNYIFTGGIWGFKLVETKFAQFIDQSKTLKVTYSVNPSDKNQHKLTLTFENPTDYSKIIEKLFTSKKKDYSSFFIVVLGHWNKDKCVIKHWKQVVLI
ncbi:hypothetical protein [Clostridium sp. ZBS4]|uniref:hypothetical protein n=1 Tax=Clostridium sp. ZBS4 TaxID=2949974 RepID=UPI0020792A14|nr:hypothetical protein [Clostridium sp. ZBS4]